MGQTISGARLSLNCIGSQLPEDAIYPRSTKDADGQLLTGANQYVVHFPKGSCHPWARSGPLPCITIDNFSFRTPSTVMPSATATRLQFNDDGSLTLYLQNESPGKDKESNWLPAPKESFNLLMRLYWPKKDILDGVWNPPKIERKDVEDKKDCLAARDGLRRQNKQKLTFASLMFPP